MRLATPSALRSSLQLKLTAERPVDASASTTEERSSCVAVAAAVVPPSRLDFVAYAAPPTPGPGGVFLFQFEPPDRGDPSTSRGGSSAWGKGPSSDYKFCCDIQSRARPPAPVAGRRFYRGHRSSPPLRNGRRPRARHPLIRVRRRPPRMIPSRPRDRLLLQIFQEIPRRGRPRRH